jgi:cardiolipin synthase (CMP-forming)
MAVAASGQPRRRSGTCGRIARYALSVVAGNVANLLTLARLFCVVPIVWLVSSADYHTAALVFVAAALTDAADGYVAKRYNQVTPLGAILDPVADKLLMDSLFLTLAFAGHLPAWLALLVIGRDLLMVAGTLALRMLAGRFRVEPLLVGKLSTFFQIILGGTVLVGLSVLPGLLAWLQPLLLVTAGLVIASALSYVHAATRIWSLARLAR